ncbi:response regulator, partial [Glutamicibacter arilaitensis]
MRVLICEDSVLLREGLVRLLDHSGHRVVADLPEASGLMPFLDSASEEDFPQICILDVRLPPTYTDEG